VAPSWKAAFPLRVDVSAITFTAVAPSRSSTNVRSPLADFLGLTLRRPVAVTKRPSSDSLRPADGTAVDAGRLPIPMRWMSALAGRISS